MEIVLILIKNCSSHDMQNFGLNCRRRSTWESMGKHNNIQHEQLPIGKIVLLGIYGERGAIKRDNLARNDGERCAGMANRPYLPGKMHVAGRENEY